MAVFLLTLYLSTDLQENSVRKMMSIENGLKGFSFSEYKIFKAEIKSKIVQRYVMLFA
jgi:hypothetical protein